MGGTDQHDPHDDELDELPAVNLVVVDGIIRTIKEKLPKQGASPFDKIRIDVSAVDLAGIDTLCRLAKSYGELQRRYSTDRELLMQILKANKTARDILYPTEKKKPKARLANRRMRALEALGFPDPTEELRLDYEFLLSQFRVDPTARAWYRRVPFDLHKKYFEFFEKTEALETPITWLKPVTKHGKQSFERLYKARSETNIKIEILELLMEKYNYDTLGAVHQALYRAGVVKGLPHVS